LLDVLYIYWRKEGFYKQGHRTAKAKGERG